MKAENSKTERGNVKRQPRNALKEEEDVSTLKLLVKQRFWYQRKEKITAKDLPAHAVNWRIARPKANVISTMANAKRNVMLSNERLTTDVPED